MLGNGGRADRPGLHVPVPSVAAMLFASSAFLYSSAVPTLIAATCAEYLAPRA